MKIFVNDKEYEIPLFSTIPDLLKFLDIKENKGFALAINSKVVPKAEWKNFTLNENDKVVLIRITQGG